MRFRFLFLPTFLLLTGFATSAPAKPKLELKDEGLSLQELRPLDRLVYILTLDGKWHEPAAAKAVYYVNLLFPDGGSYAHRVLDEELFPKGEVRVVIQGHQLVRHGIARGGKFTVVVSKDRPVESAQAPEVISDKLSVTWPMERRISRFRPHSRHQPPEPLDAFPIPGEEEARPALPPRPKAAPAPVKSDKGTKSS
jgi:hypothetical protein